MTQAGATLLVVEDDEGDAVYLAACLEDLRVPADRVRWARTLADARTAVLGAPVDCILVDLGLPDASGLETVTGMVDADPDAAVIVLTGLHDLRGEQALAAGAQDYLVKDALSADLLGRCMRYAVERKRAERTARQLDEARLRSEENARLERGLLPRPILTSGRVASATTYQPGRGQALLGGDFYDIVERPDGSIRAVIGDVMGHGPDEAALGVHLRVAWRSLVLSGAPDGEVLPTLHRLLLAERLPSGTFATACDLTIAPDLASATVRSAGHPPPIVALPTGAGYLHVLPAPPLGIGGTAPWQTSAPLPGDWQLLLYTDGLLDAFRDTADLRDVGLERLERVASGSLGGGPDAWVGHLIAGALQDVNDDLAVVALARVGTTS